MSKRTHIDHRANNRFPLSLHRTGQWYKKIRGKFHYFGADKDEAHRRYLEVAAALHEGRTSSMASAGGDYSLRMLANMYLEQQEAKLRICEIGVKHYYDQVNLLRHFVKYIGPERHVSELKTIDFQNYRTKLIRSGKSPNTINNRVSAVKALFHWAVDNEVVDKAPNLKALKRATPKRDPRQTFDVAQVHELLKRASSQMRAMIWLGLNCGFGCMDCAELRWDHLDLEKGRVNLPRAKTGIGRNLLLWAETIDALRLLPRRGERVFYTRRGNAWVQAERVVGENGDVKYSKENTVSKEFTKLLNRAGIKREKGVGFYTLRRTAATLAARSGDPFAVKNLLGHADLRMATRYVQDTSEQTDRVMNDVRTLIVQDGSRPWGTAGGVGGPADLGTV